MQAAKGRANLSVPNKCDPITSNRHFTAAHPRKYTLRDSSTGTMKKSLSVDRSCGVLSNNKGRISYENDIFVIPVHRVITRSNNIVKDIDAMSSILGSDDDEVSENQTLRLPRPKQKLLDIPKLQLDSIDASQITKSKSSNDEGVVSDHDESENQGVGTLGPTPYVRPDGNRSIGEIHNNVLRPKGAGERTKNDYLKIKIQTCTTSSESCSGDESNGGKSTRRSMENLCPSKLFPQKRQPKIKRCASEDRLLEQPEKPIYRKSVNQLQQFKRRISTPVKKEVEERGKEMDHEVVCPHCKFRWNLNFDLESKKCLDYFRRRFDIPGPNNSFQSTAYSMAQNTAQTMRPKRNPHMSNFTCLKCNAQEQRVPKTEPLTINGNPFSFGEKKYQENGTSCQTTQPSREYTYSNMNAGTAYCNSTFPHYTSMNQQSFAHQTENLFDLTNRYISNNPIFNTLPVTRNSTSATNINLLSNSNNNNAANSNTTALSSPPFNLHNPSIKLYTPFAAINPWSTLRLNNNRGCSSTNNPNLNFNLNNNESNAYASLAPKRNPYFWGQF